MSAMTLRLHPVDVWMFRETRYFAEATSDSRSEFPLPKTVAGALRTLMMRAARVDLRAIREAMRNARRDAAGEAEYMEALKGHLRAACKAGCSGTWPVDATIAGPFLWRGGSRWYPLPRSIVKTKNGQVVALKPAASDVPGWDAAAGRRPLFAGTAEAVEGWEQAYVSAGDLGRFLGGELLEASSIKERRTFIADEPRVGIAIEADSGTVGEGLIYSSTFLRLKDDTALEVDLEFGGDPPAELTTYLAATPWLRLGGEGRVARIGPVDPPASPPEPKGEGAPLVYLATPALFEGERWHPDGVTPLAAAVGSPQVFSGWDLAANLPMKTRYAVPAGAVYFYDTGDTQLPDHATCVSDDPDDKAAGWGYCLRGVWS
ncbi:MAG: type III-B CRISPR module-associated protein Cmr3 [Armatimonadota bacterium]